MSSPTRLTRLRAMSPLEIFYRMSMAARDLLLYACLRCGLFDESLEAFATRLRIKHGRDDALDQLRDQVRQRSVFPWQSIPEATIFQHYKERFPANLAATEQCAQAVVDHQFTIFGSRVAFQKKMDWFYDPLLKQSLKVEHWKKINYHSSEVVKEVKYIWELNRHQHFVTLAKAWFLTRNDGYAEELAVQWSDWLVQNPYQHGVNWTSALECAFRLISWTWALQFVKTSRCFSAELYASILQSVEQHARYISTHLSRYSSANNHLLGEALGLIYAGSYYPELSDAPAWRKKGFRLFYKQFLKQVYQDGVGKEQSVWYQHYVFQFAVLTRLAAEHAGVVFPAVADARLRKMAEFMCALSDHGYVPNIGDEDGGAALFLSEAEKIGPAQFQPVAAALYGSAFCLKAHCDNETAFWLFPHTPVPASVIPTMQPRLRQFLQGGYVVVDQPLGSSAYKLILDCGPLGLGKMAAHGHADALGIWLSVGGEPVLIDSGTYLYLGAGEERSNFRGTRAHNTLCIDGRDSAEQLGAFQWGKRPRVILEEIRDSAPIYLRASHNGFHPLKCVREVEVQPRTLCIRDSVKGVGNHTIDVYFHLAPGSIERISNRVVCRYSRCQVDFSFEATAAFDTSLETAFHSPRFGEKKEHTVIRLSSTAKLPITLTTKIGVYEKD